MKKVRCSFLGLFSLLGLILAQNGIETSVDTYLSDDPYEVKDFIAKNFDKFSTEVNRNSELEWKAKKIDTVLPITIVDLGEKKTGILLDFDKDNGYAVLGNKFTFYDFKLFGDSPYDGITSDEYYFNNGEYYYGENQIPVNSYKNYDQYFLSGETDDGHKDLSSGCGEIINVDKYLNYHYGSDYTLVRENSLDMQGKTQGYLSIYVHNRIENGQIKASTEANCWAASAFNALQYLQKTKLQKLPKESNKVMYDPAVSEPRIYDDYYEKVVNSNSTITYKNITSLLTVENGKQRYEYEEIKDKMIPKLWVDIRKYCNDKWAKINYGMLIETSEIIEVIGNKYGYNLDAVEHYNWQYYMYDGFAEIDKGIPLIWSTSSGTYGSHTMVACGYKCFQKMTGWWIFQSVDTKVFYELRDGWNDYPTYFDMSGHWWFSGFVSIEIR